MAIDYMMTTPYGYGTQRVTLGWLEAKLLDNYHPEYVARLIAWLNHKGGLVGVGGGFRPDGTQPDGPTFAPAGKSFHQNQSYADGFIGACAVDLVMTNPGGIHAGIPWSEVPQQGSAEAATWGVHCNVGTPGKPGSESWHMQPVEIDGHTSWVNAGRPAPVLDYPFPGRLPVPPPEPPKDTDMAQIRFSTTQRTGQFLIGSGIPLLLTEDIVKSEPFKSVPKVVGDGPQEDARWDEYFLIYKTAQSNGLEPD